MERFAKSEDQRMIDVQTELADKNVFRAGTLAYYDTFAGLIPCKVMTVRRKGYGFRVEPRDDAVQFEITETRGAYTKGEVISSEARMVPPRKMIKKRQYSNTIMTCYSYVPETETPT